MRLCSGQGCGRAVPDDRRYCGECQAEADAKALPVQDERVHSSGYDALLDSLRKSLRWQRLRRLIVQRNPICRRCDRAISEIVDHIVPAREAIAQAQVSGKFPGDLYAGYFLKSNLQGLCRACHYEKTIEDKTHVGPWPDVIDCESKAPRKRWTFG